MFGKVTGGLQKKCERKVKGFICFRLLGERHGRGLHMQKRPFSLFHDGAYKAACIPLVDTVRRFQSQIGKVLKKFRLKCEMA